MSQITVITGCMFSGKTNRFIALTNSARVSGKKVGVFKPDIDTRTQNIVSRDGSTILAEQIKANVPDGGYYVNCFAPFEVVCIDESQFFTPVLVEVVKFTSGRGKEFIISGLAKDYKCDPFGPMPFLLAIADVIIQEYAVCNTCKSRQATRTHRIAGGTDQILVGSADLYEAACPDCYTRLTNGSK